MKRALVAAVSLFLAPAAGLFVSIEAAVVDSGQQQRPAWENVWNKKVDARIRSLIRQVDSERMSKNLFALAKDPLPYRKLNFTLPGHQKNTLYEADDYISGRLTSLGYRVEREGVQVQAFRRDTSKPKQAQYSRPMPEDPWYTAYNLYSEKKGRSNPGEIILVLAHKDSQSWIDSPGANDNAIGTVSVLEMAT
ncbi:MAG: M28 family peptidase, partial [Acidobacteriales bacterium]|nr:M28 family peptidase [Terriglobales bacterium]